MNLIKRKVLLSLIFFSFLPSDGYSVYFISVYAILDIPKYLQPSESWRGFKTTLCVSFKMAVTPFYFYYSM